MNKLEISKLVKILQKEKDRQTIYAKDDYYYRYNLGYLIRTLDDEEEVKYEIRGFKFDKDELRLSLVNWTHHAGTCSLLADQKILNDFRYEGFNE